MILADIILKVPREAYNVHQYKTEDLIHCESFYLVGREFLNWINSFHYDIVLLIAHNKIFDQKIIKNELKSVGLNFPDNWIFGDTINFGNKKNCIYLI